MPHNLVFKSLKGRGYSLRSPFDKENAKKPSCGFVCLSDLICFSTKKNPCYACTCNAMAHGAFVDRCPVVLSEQSKLLLSSFSVLTSEQRGGIIGVFSNKYYHHSVNYNVMSNNMHKDLLCFWYFKIKKNIYFSTNITFLRVQREWNMKRIFVVEQQESTQEGRLWLNTTIKTKCTIFWLWRRSANNLSVSKTQNWNTKPRHLTQIKSIFVISSHTNKKFGSYVLHKSHGKKDFQRQVCILRDGRRSCSTRLSYQVFFYWSRPQKRWRGQNPSFFGLWTFAAI